MDFSDCINGIEHKASALDYLLNYNTLPTRILLSIELYIIHKWQNAALRHPFNESKLPFTLWHILYAIVVEFGVGDRDSEWKKTTTRLLLFLD